MFRLPGRFFCLWIFCGLAAANSLGGAPFAGWERLYVGAYTWNSSRGVYCSGLDLGTGVLSATNLAGATTSASWVLLHPNRRFLYAVNEDGGKVVAFSVNAATGGLTLLNQQDSNGASPCHLALDQSGKFLFVANYTGGSFTVFPIQPDGRLAAATAHMQHAGTAPHVHCIALDRNNQFALVCDLGLDRVYSYRFDSLAGTVTANSVPWTTVPAGAGPRHLAFGPADRRVYVICEKNSTVIGFNYNATNGTLASFQTLSTLPSGYSGQKWAAEIAFHPSGRFLYASNRGYNSVAVFTVEAATGALTLVQQQPTGQTPRHFAIDPGGRFCLVANQDSDEVRLYAIDPQTGLLSSTAQKLSVSKPVCVVPFITQPPQPVVGSSLENPGSLRLSVGNSLCALTYEVQENPGLNPGQWNRVVTGVPGQTNFSISNLANGNFYRMSVITNY
jgi:6-phosphogluconolactonase